MATGSIKHSSHEEFHLIFSSSITDIVYVENCFYDADGQFVHIDFRIYSPRGLIPLINVPIASVPSKYKP